MSLCASAPMKAPAIALLLFASSVQAHPMGNMGVSHYSELMAEPERITLNYVLDFAEIPTFLELQKHAVTASPGMAAPPSFMRTLTTQVTGGLSLVLGGRAIALTAVAPCRGQFSPGAAGMLTLRMTCAFQAPAPRTAAPYAIQYRDANYSQRSGWKEVILRSGASMQTLASTVPETGHSAALTVYPDALAKEPPQVLEARATVQQVVRSATR